MKYLKGILFTIITVLVFTVTPTLNVNAADEERVVIYFKETTCENCAEVAGYLSGPSGPYTESEDYLKKMTDQGITVIIYDIMENPEVPAYSYVDDETGNTVNPLAIDVFAAFNPHYSRSNKTVPVIFVGDSYFEGTEEIKGAIDANTVYDLSVNPIKTVNVQEGQAYADISGFVGFLTVLGAGLLDGFNPCAIALLLLFVSLLGFSEDKRVLLLVSVVYISALFVSYYLIGRFFMSALLKYSAQISAVGTIINWFVALLCLFLFSFNFYDFLQARNEDYGNIKNQLPKWLQRFNKKIVKAFMNVINSENNKGLIPVLGLTFILGITLSVTELVCTGQIYFGILYGITTLDSADANILLLVYNLMFVLPLIIIAVASIRMKSVMSISNWIREHMTYIKLTNSILFFGIALYFFSRIEAIQNIFKSIGGWFS